MAAYGDVTEAKRRLDIEGDDLDDTLDAYNAALSLTFEQKLGGVTFGDAVSDARIVFGDGACYPTLLLPTGMRVVGSIQQAPTWDGTDWIGGTLLDDDAYRLVLGRKGIGYQIERLKGWGWNGPYLVTGEWADQPDGTVPTDVVEALTVLVVGTFKRDRTQDGEVSGPEGFTFKPGDPWKDQRVTTAIERYRLARIAV